MADVRCRLSWMDMGCFRFFYGVDDNYRDFRGLRCIILGRVLGKSLRRQLALLGLISICQGMTVTLMLRSVGAIIFGILADRYGRKWPMIINLFLFIVLELCSGFCNTLPQFLGVRSLYGIAMGGRINYPCRVIVAKLIHV